VELLEVLSTVALEADPIAECDCVYVLKADSIADNG